MRILLTGASGFIGSHLLAKLLKNNIPVAIIRHSNNDPWRIKKYLKDIIVIDHSSDTITKNVSKIQEFSPDTLIHLGWYGVENKYRNNQNQIVENLSRTVSIFNMAHSAGVKTIIGLGSQAEYGPNIKPIDENMETVPTTIYGVAKLCSYQVLNLLCKQNDIRFSWLRLFSAYGPMDNSCWLIPMIILTLLKREVPSLTKGEQQWDYLYISDICDAIYSVFANPEAQGIFNLGSGKTHSIRSIAEKIRDIIDPSLPINFGKIPYGPDQIMYLRSNNGRLCKTTGWVPQIHLHEGLQTTIDWYRKNAKLFDS